MKSTEATPTFRNGDVGRADDGTGHSEKSGLRQGRIFAIILLVLFMISIKFTLVDFTRWGNVYRSSLRDGQMLAKTKATTTGSVPGTGTSKANVKSPSFVLEKYDTMFKKYNDTIGGTTVTLPNISDSNTNSNQQTNTRKVRIGFATTLTDCNRNHPKFLQFGAYAAVLHRSLQIAYSHSTKYDFDLMMFVHPTAEDCAPLFAKLGYQIQIRDTPFNETRIQNDILRSAQKNGCCGSKEYLKLYSYLQFDYPIVVHLDLDVIVLKPMDDAFDLFLSNPATNSNNKVSVTWKDQPIPKRIDFMFTRDYNMVDPPKRQPHQIGVQGGFLMVRPNATDFDELVKIILSGGDFSRSHGWGGPKKAHGGYYGAATIQGLASYYYGSVSTGRSVELSRCHYNAMIDDPYNTAPFVNDEREPPKKTKLMCRTLEPDLKCEDCRLTPLEEIFMTHFTVCGKPQYCANPVRWWNSKMQVLLPNTTMMINPNTNTKTTPQIELCMQLFREWHKVRRSIEDEWQLQFSDYHPQFQHAPERKVDETIESYAWNYYQNYSYGHCPVRGGPMIAMSFPKVFWEDGTAISKSLI